MTPEPGRVRMPPPRVPPAPPGTGSSQPFGRGDGAGNQLYQMLAGGLDDLAVIRAASETAQIFAVDLELQDDLALIVQSACENLKSRLALAAEAADVQSSGPLAQEARQRLGALLTYLEDGIAGAKPDTFATQVLDEYATVLMLLIRHGADRGPAEP